MVKITIEENDAGQRLDRFLRKYLRKAPLSSIYRMIRKDVKVNGKRAAKDRMLEVGDELILYISEEQVAEFARPTLAPGAKATALAKARQQFKIAYEDDHLIIVSKPVGLLTHGDRKEKKNTLANQVCGYLQLKGEFDPARERIFRPSPLNRLDRNTSGLVIFGKSAEAARQITKMLRQRDGVRKFYMTIVCGRLEEARDISRALVKDEARNLVSAIGDEANGDGRDGGHSVSGKESITRVEPLKVGKDFSLAEVELLTGRTHQIRVHLAQIGHPLAGDPKYGDAKINARLKKEGMTTQFLHAYKLEFAKLEGADAAGGEAGMSAADGEAGAGAAGVLAGIAGKTIEVEPPAAFKAAERALVGGR